MIMREIIAEYGANKWQALLAYPHRGDLLVLRPAFDLRTAQMQCWRELRNYIVVRAYDYCKRIAIGGGDVIAAGKLEFKLLAMSGTSK